MAWGTSSQNRECPGTVGTYMYMYDVGQHPLVNRLLKGVFHLRPPQPQHTQTWDVGLVTCNCKLFQIKRWEEITTVSRSNSQTCSAYDINKAIEINWSWSLYLHRSSCILPEGVTNGVGKTVKISWNMEQSSSIHTMKDYAPRPVLALREYE